MLGLVSTAELNNGVEELVYYRQQLHISIGIGLAY